VALAAIYWHLASADNHVEAQKISTWLSASMIAIVM